MTEKIAFQLRQENKLTGCIAVKIRYSDFDTHTSQQSVPYTNQDHIILQTVKELFVKVNSRRLLIRLIGVRFSNLIPGNYQVDMFNDTQVKVTLYQRISLSSTLAKNSSPKPLSFAQKTEPFYKKEWIFF